MYNNLSKHFNYNFKNQKSQLLSKLKFEIGLHMASIIGDVIVSS